MERPWVSLDDDAALDAEHVGVKAANLAAAMRRGAAVPAGACLPARSSPSSMESVIQALAAHGDWLLVRRSPGPGPRPATLPPQGAAFARGIQEATQSRRLLELTSDLRGSLPVLLQRAVQAPVAYGAVLWRAGPAGLTRLIQWRPGAPWDRNAEPDVGGGWDSAKPGDGFGDAADPTLRDAVERLVVAARAAVGKPLGLQWLWDGDQAWLVRLSTLAEMPARTVISAPADVTRTFELDAEHNPEPLSAATVSLVAHLGRHAALPFRQCTHDGYLYAARLEPAGVKEALALAHSRAAEPPDVPGARSSDAVEAGLHRFARFSESYFAATVPWRHSRERLSALLEAHGGEALAQRTGELLTGIGGVGPQRDLLLAAASGADDDLGAFGAFAPAWDLASPTYAEASAPLQGARVHLDASDLRRRLEAASARAAAVASEVEAEVPEADRSAFRETLQEARDAARRVEEDDLAFAQALRDLRNALLEHGEDMVRAGQLQESSDVFHLPIRWVVGAHLTGRPGPYTGAARAARARQAMARLRPPPLRVTPASPARPRAASAAWANGAAVLRGTGASVGEATGTVVISTAPGQLSALPAGTVLVVRSATPAFSYLLPQCAALITEHGGLLSHAAVLAREYGVPAVLAVPDATRRLRAGSMVFVDGSAGTVTVLAPRPGAG